MKKISFSEIEETANSLGIKMIGFTDKYDSQKIAIRLKERIDKNFHTEFEHPLEDRIAPERILNNWKSIISIALPYEEYNRNSDKAGDRFIGMQKTINTLSTIEVISRGDSKHSSKSLKGFVSKSAVGQDYHIRLKNIMGKLIEKLEENYSFEYSIGVDTTPLLDREIAHSSGIGFYGKNNSIINYEYGSKIFLGYILVDFEIVDDRNTNKYQENAETNGCGDCDLCLISCPTGSIKADQIMNCKICLSYLTQTKEVIPYELREKMGSMIYGCDICVNVCPYNSKKETSKEDLEISNNIEKNSTEKYEKTLGSSASYSELSYTIDIEELLFMSNRQFKEKYGDTAISWRGKNVLRRNAIIALNKIKSDKTVDILVRLLSDNSKMIRDYAVWALYKKDRERVFEIIRSRKLKKSVENEIKEELERIEKFYAG